MAQRAGRFSSSATSAASSADAVRNGRRQEFARFAAFRDPAQRECIPDPQAEQTFDDSKLDWERLADPTHAATLRWYRDLLAVRRRHIVPLLSSLSQGGEFSIVDQGALVVRWRGAGGAELTLMANLSARASAGISGRTRQPAVAGRPRRRRRHVLALEPALDRAQLTSRIRATRHNPARHLPPAAATGLRLRARRRRWRRTCRPSASVTSTCRRTSRRAPGSTHGYDIVDHRQLNPAARRRGRVPAHVRVAASSTRSVRSSTSCPITWAWAAPTIRCGSMCSNGGRMPRTPAGSISTGTRSDATCTTRSWCRCSATSTASNSSAACCG